MKRIARALGPILSVLALAASAACAAPAQSSQPPSSAHGRACKVAGSECRWDNQCCSSHCYVDTGCSG